MSGIPILEVAIGLSLVYLLLALLCTTLNEMLAGWLRLRAKALESGIEMMLSDPKVFKELSSHSLIRSLSTRRGLPSYIPADKFALALMDVLAHPVKEPSEAAAELVKSHCLETGKAHLQQAVRALRLAPEIKPEAGERPAEQALLAVADPQVAAAHQKRIEGWFNDAMDRVSGAYKRGAQVRVLVLAALVTLVVNADTRRIAHVLWTSPAVRAAVVDVARTRVEKGPPSDLPSVQYPDPNDPDTAVLVKPKVESPLTQREQELLGQLTGWDDDFRRLPEPFALTPFAVWFGDLVVRRGLGWLATILAVSLGAPFWFDMLQKFVNVRNAGRPPKKDAEGTKEKTS